jgi:hypothetical protein
VQGWQFVVQFGVQNFVGPLCLFQLLTAACDLLKPNRGKMNFVPKSIIDRPHAYLDIVLALGSIRL